MDIYAPLAPRLQATGLSEAFAVAAAGPYLYIAAGSNGLIVGQSDVTNHVQRLGRLAWQDTARQLALCGPQAYVGGQQAIAVVDITTPQTPTLRSTLELDTPVVDLACTDTLLAVAEASGLRLIDASQRQRTVPVPGGLRRVAWWGEHYLLGMGETGKLTLFDLTDPATPRIQWRLDVASPLQDFALYSHHVYVAAASGILRISIQRTAAGQPHTVWNGEPLALTIWGRQLVLLDTKQGLVRLDLSNPAAPQQLDTAPVQGNLSMGRLQLHATPTPGRDHRQTAGR